MGGNGKSVNPSTTKGNIAIRKTITGDIELVSNYPFEGSTQGAGGSRDNYMRVPMSPKINDIVKHLRDIGHKVGFEDPNS
jgi:hypothetical protein